MKRTFDLIVSILLAIVLAPLIVILCGLTWIVIGRPIFFVQERPGWCAEIFPLIKFRTMKFDVDCKGLLMPDHLRLGSFGRFMRKTSMDELPELWNVIKGEMSLVGPRPLLIEYLEYYTDKQAQRHEVRPGITGWAQVNGRNALSWEDKFKLDIWYINHQSFYLDLKILFMTIKQVIRSDGINQPGSPTVEKFKGTAE